MLDLKDFYPVPGFEKQYAISKDGVVISYPNPTHKNIKILKNVISKNGYPCTQFTVGRKYKRFYIHRLLAKIFIPNPENKPQVNHKNSIRSDHSIQNLEWCSIAENSRYQLKRNKKTSSKYKGVMWNKQKGQWHARVVKNGKSYHAGYYDEEVDAATAYNLKAYLLFGNFCKANA